jgi:endonuclease/exonuclease/phosphatase family metal-dependent hydrolase
MAITSATYAHDLKILSLNLQCIENDWNKRLNEITNLIKIKRPDILLFQEVCINNQTNSLQDLINKFNENKLHYPYHAKQFTHDAWDGLYKEYIAVFSAHQFDQVDQGPLPPSPLQRGYLAINIFDNWIVNTHLEYKDEYSSFRKKQVEFLSKRFTNSKTVIGGDLNSGPASFEQQDFFKFNFTPAFIGPTYPSDKPEFTLDGFWLSQPLIQKTNNYQVSRITQINKLSDHLAIELYLNLAK